MAARKFRAGSRVPAYRSTARISKNRYAWARTVLGAFTIMKYENLDDLAADDPEANVEYIVGEPGYTVRAIIPLPGRKPISWNMTLLTHEELLVMKQYFDTLFELAEPVCIERDKAANEAYEAGDDTLARLYRGVPEFTLRERAVPTNRQGVRVGPQAVSAGRGREVESERGNVGSTGDLRSDSSVLVDGEPKELGTQDDRA